MALERVTLAKIAEMDGGKIGHAFQGAVRRCLKDCRDRPNLSKARTITLTVTMAPPKDAEGAELDVVAFACALKEALPKRDSREYSAVLQGGDMLVNELSPSDARQRTIDEETPVRRVGGN